jgi:hypothetical protein
VLLLMLLHRPVSQLASQLVCAHLQRVYVKDDDAGGAASAGWDVGQDARQREGSRHVTLRLNLRTTQNTGNTRLRMLRSIHTCGTRVAGVMSQRTCW